MVHSGILHPHFISRAVCGKYVVLRRYYRGLVELAVKVPHAQLVPTACIVEFRHPLIVMLFAFRAEVGQLPARPIRKRDAIEEVLCHRIDSVGGDLVVWKWLPGNGIYKLPGYSREISAPFSSSRHEGDVAGCRCGDACTLICAEEKKFILQNGTTHTSAKLIAFQRILRRGEEVPCVEISVAQEFEDRPMQLVCARSGNDVHDAAAGIAIFGGEVVRLKIEFLNGIRIWEGDVHVQISVVVAHAVQLIVDLPHAGAINARCLFVGINTAVSTNAAAVSTQVHCARREEDQALRETAVQWQFGDLLSVHQLPHRSAACVYEVGVGLYRNFFADLSDSQRDDLVSKLVYG